MLNDLTLHSRAEKAKVAWMSTVKEITAAIPKLPPKELAELKEWLDDFFEDQLELSDEVKAKLEESRAEIAAGRYRSRQP